MDCPKRSRHGSPRGLFLEALSRYRSTQAARAALNFASSPQASPSLTWVDSGYPPECHAGDSSTIATAGGLRELADSTAAPMGTS
jgi:hypothetical protein